MELTTVADDLAVVHDGVDVHRLEGLAPDTDFDVAGCTGRTLSRPPGELLCRVGHAYQQETDWHRHFPPV